MLRALILGFGLLALVSCAKDQGQPSPALPVNELRADQYEFVTDPGELPRSVRSALASALGQTPLRMAAAGEPYNWSDVVDESLPYHRIIVAAVGRRYVIVQFEEGGFSPSWRTMVFSRSLMRSEKLWSGAYSETFRDPGEFARAIRSGQLWDAQRTGSQP